MGVSVTYTGGVPGTAYDNGYGTVYPHLGYRPGEFNVSVTWTLTDMPVSEEEDPLMIFRPDYSGLDLSYVSWASPLPTEPVPASTLEGTSWTATFTWQGEWTTTLVALNLDFWMGPGPDPIRWESAAVSPVWVYELPPSTQTLYFTTTEAIPEGVDPDDEMAIAYAWDYLGAPWVDKQGLSVGSDLYGTAETPAQPFYLPPTIFNLYSSQREFYFAPTDGGSYSQTVTATWRDPNSVVIDYWGDYPGSQYQRTITVKLRGNYVAPPSTGGGLMRARTIGGGLSLGRRR